MDDRTRMEHRAPWIPWAFTSLALVAVAFIAYSFGASREAGTLAAEPVRWRGFGGFWLIFLFFWIFGGLRWMWWGPYYRPWRYGRYYHPRYYSDEREDWEEWHRREHDRMERPGGPRPPSSAPPTQGPNT